MQALTHSGGAVVIFSVVYVVQNVARPQAARRDKLFSAMAAVVCWFCGREFRDYEKQDTRPRVWDYWGFFPPVILAVLLNILFSQDSVSGVDPSEDRTYLV